MSGFVKIGVSKGVLAEHDKIYAPDPELLKLLTEDFSSQLHMFGQAVVGMTSAWMQQYANQWAEQRREQVQARWDARRERMRMDRNTATALGAPRRQGRL